MVTALRHLANIPFDVSFLQTVAHRWLAIHQPHPERGQILLPTRRAARELASAFLNAAGGRPMLLPRITAIGAADEAPLLLTDQLEVAPAIEPALRLATLTRMVLQLPVEQGGVKTLDQAWLLARELALLIDEADRAELNLGEALARAAEGEHATHWQVTLQFMQIVTRAFPEWLAANGLINPVARQVMLFTAQARAWEQQGLSEPVWAVGMSGAIPSVARLLHSLVRRTNGMVVMQGLDYELTEDAWGSIGESHPQFGLAALLASLDCRRADVENWNAASISSGRVSLLSQALLPASALDLWRHPLQFSRNSLTKLRAADQQEEAVAIAMVLRDALEQPGARAALVTSDRALAARVAAELLRWGVVADDSAGEKLAESPPAVFLRLIARAVGERLSPVPLLSLLKHPYAAAGVAAAHCRDGARTLEIAGLRGPKPLPGITGLRLAAEKASPPVQDLVARLERCLEPLLRVAASTVASVEVLLEALIAAAENLCETSDQAGSERLWAREEGEALANLLTDILPALAGLPDISPDRLPELLDALLADAVVHSGRALRGRGDKQEHARIFIWGLLEARLQSVELVVLGGLVDTVWPPATDPGPWMSRPMRRRAGLPSPEAKIGQSAHDFVAAACCAPTTVLSYARRREGAPAVPSRWLARIDAFLHGQGQKLDDHPAARWAQLLDHPAGPAVPALPPQPRPPVSLRPRRLSVTEVETWLTDPYAIHARHILGLRWLPPLEQSTDAADYGALVHAGLHEFVTLYPDRLPLDARSLLRATMDRALQRAGLRQALVSWWMPRLHRIADWVIEHELEQRDGLLYLHVRGELLGEWPLQVPGGFVLTGRADRIERRPDGSLAIVDYKTGTLPTHAAVEAGFAPQLPLESAMLQAGAFGPDMIGQAHSLAYWRLSGGAEAGMACELFKGDARRVSVGTIEAKARLLALITAYDDPQQAYLAQPHPSYKPRFPRYGQLARVDEWDLLEDDI